MICGIEPSWPDKLLPSSFVQSLETHPPSSTTSLISAVSRSCQIAMFWRAHVNPSTCACFFMLFRILVFCLFVSYFSMSGAAGSSDFSCSMSSSPESEPSSVDDEKYFALITHSLGFLTKLSPAPCMPLPLDGTGVHP